MSNKVPQVSVVMSVFNGERYLNESVESIIKQTFRDFEFIILNDGSTDSSAHIIREYAQADDRIQVFDQKNMGLTKSLNRGISLARGKWIARQDADDISMTTRLEKQLEYLKDHPEVGMLGTSWKIINSAGKIIDICQVDDGDADIRFYLLTRNDSITHGSVMFSRSVFKLVGGYDESLKYSQDYDLWWRMAQYTKLAALPDPLYCFRKHNKSISRTQRYEQAQIGDRVSARNCLDGIRETLKLLKERKVDSKFADVSVIICTRDRYNDLVRCICYLLKQDLLPKEILIVDASKDRTVETMVSRKLDVASPVIRYIRSKPGLAHQRNTGIRKSCGSIILFLNDDMLLYPEFVRNILHVFNEAPGLVGGVGGNIINVQRDEKSYRALLCRIFFSYGFGDGSFKRSGAATYPYGLSEVKEVKFLGGGQMAYRREVCEEFWFDESFSGEHSFMEDVDFSFRVSRKYKNYFTPHARSFHNKKTLLERFKSNGYQPVEIKYHWYHFRKNVPKNLLNWMAFDLSVLHIRYQYQLDTVLKLLSTLKRSFKSMIGM